MWLEGPQTEYLSVGLLGRTGADSEDEKGKRSTGKKTEKKEMHKRKEMDVPGFTGRDTIM